MENAPPEPITDRQETYARLAEELDRRAVSHGWRGTLKDLIIALLAAAMAAGMLAVSVGTLSAMTGLISNSKPFGWIFLGFLIPITLLAFWLFRRDSRFRRKTYEDRWNTIVDAYPDFPAFYTQRRHTRP